MKFFDAIANMFRVPDLRKRILFTLGMLAIYRLGGHIPTPGVDTNQLQKFFEQNQGTIFGFVDLFSGGMLRRLTIFALGIMPYITASIILQLLTVVVPTLEKLQKEGELGRRKITQWTRYLTVILALIQSFGIAMALQNSGGGLVLNPGIGFVLMTMLSLTTGTAFIMWLGEQITERGIGNGMSLIIFTGIVVGLPRAVQEVFQQRRSDAPMDCAAFDHHHSRHGRSGGVYRSGGARRAAHPGAICQARGRPAHDGRTIHAPAAQSKRGRRDPGDFRFFAAGLPDHLAVLVGGKELAAS